MNTIEINGTGGADNGSFHAEVVFPSSNKYHVTVTDPFREEGSIETDQEERLRWYFEEHLWSPYTDKEKAKRAADSITFYGETLFSRLFADERALAEFRALTHGLDELRLQIFSDDPRFQGLHWEALKDPDETQACCLKDLAVVRTSGTYTPTLEVQPGGTLNVLMVTARPGGKNDVDYRTITRPVVETVAGKQMPVHLHLLRPPTFQHLKEHLRDKKGFYHIIHFDVHGDVLSYPEYQAVMEGAGKAILSGGRRGMKPYDGVKAFLLLVGEKGGAYLVAADEVAELLRGAHIPICFLNACRSGTATLNITDAPGVGFSLEASLAMRFLERGVKLVLGMAWSVTVTAARIMMTELYHKLTGGEDTGKALNLARQALFENGCRFQAADCTLVLEDWLLPVVWGKGDFSISLQKPYPEDITARLERERLMEAQLKDVQREGEYGFLGRDVDVLVIETMLQAKNILLVKGMGGTGKTTLLGHLGEWWLKTGWLDYVFYFGYDRKPYRAEEILNVMAEAVMPPNDFAAFVVMTDVETKAMSLTTFLKEGKNTPRVLLILDNLESVTGTEQAVGSRLEEAEQKILTSVLKRLMQSSIKVLLGSRADEEWLGETTFKDNIHVLEGLDHVSRFDLAERILGDMTPPDSEEFKRLMDILAGYPLAMEIILPNLSSRSARELREFLTGEEIDLQGGRVSEEIFKCINISFSLLTEKAQQSMLVFAPFTSFLNATGLEVYLEKLQASGFSADLTLADLEEALRQGERQGVLKQLIPQLYSIQPVFPFFLGEQVARVFDESAQAALEQGFCRYMSELAKAYQQLMESKEPGERQTIFLLFRQDRENLYKALHRMLDSKEDFYDLYNVFGFFYHQHPLYNEAIAFMEGVAEKLESYSKKDQIFLINYGYVVGNLGSNYMEIKSFSKARDNLSKSLTLLQQAGKRHEMAMAYHQLGYVAQGERDWAEAKRNYQKALQILREFKNRYSQAGTYHQLGRVSEEERDSAEAERQYREALNIYQEFDDRYGQAKIYQGLGNVAFGERDWTEAKRYYWEALKIKQEFNDRYSQASTYHQLGKLAAKERNWSVAKQHYRKALKICQEFNDRYTLGKAYYELGNIAFEEKDWAEAKRHYREALKIFQEFNDRYEQAGIYGTLGNVALEETDYPSALNYYVMSLDIFSVYNNEYNVDITIENLSILLAMETWDAAKAIAGLDVTEERKQELLGLLENTQ